ncbi:hypothetical protein ACWEQ0_05120 [Nocardia thailandica]
MIVHRSLVLGAGAALALLTGCGAGSPPPAPSATASAAPVTSTAEPDQARSLRIHQQLIDLGCDTNSCIQVYFGCLDGYITGDACEFFRAHPPVP